MASTLPWLLLCLAATLASFVGGGNGEMDEETVQAVRRLERRIDQLQRELDRERSSKAQLVDRGELSNAKIYTVDLNASTTNLLIFRF